MNVDDAITIEDAADAVCALRSEYFRQTYHGGYDVRTVAMHPELLKRWGIEACRDVMALCGFSIIEAMPEAGGALSLWWRCEGDHATGTYPDRGACRWEFGVTISDLHQSELEIPGGGTLLVEHPAPRRPGHT